MKACLLVASALLVVVKSSDLNVTHHHGFHIGGFSPLFVGSFELPKLNESDLPEGKEGGNSACFGRYDRSVAFSCLLLIPSAIESAYNDTKVHAVSEKLKCGPLSQLMS